MSHWITVVIVFVPYFVCLFITLRHAFKDDTKDED